MRLPYLEGEGEAPDALAASLGPQPGRPTGQPIAPTPPEPLSETITLAGGTLTCETSLRSNLRDDPDLGRLVATERGVPPGAAPYSPLRRRWFAKAGPGSTGPGSTEAGLAGLDLALSPEWVRDARLPAAFRAELATRFAGVAADWEAEAFLVGLNEGGATLALSLPRHLAAGHHPHAAFLIGAPSRALTLERVTPLNAAPALAYTTTRTDLPRAPACLTFAGVALPLGPATILFLHDDLIGRITIPAETSPVDEPRS